YAFQAKRFHYWQLEKITTKLPPHMDQDIPQMLVDMEKDEPLGMHNSFMQLKGFDSVKDTQSVLHVFLLGPATYNHSASTQNINYPLVKKSAVPEIDKLVIPQPLKNVYAEDEVKQIFKVNLNKKQVLKKKNYFILSQLIGGVNAIWMVQKPGNQSSYFFHTTLFQKLDENGFYRMREIQKTSHKAFVHTS
ncbi:hypothetical protein PSTT_03637, partial [Puccinia striiformis]